MRNIIRYLSAGVARHLSRPATSPRTSIATFLRHELLYFKLSRFTMIPPPVFRANLALAGHARSVPGSIVECGVWKGGMISAISAILGHERQYHLFDSFEGLPPARAIDGASAIEWQTNTNAGNYYDNCSATVDDAIRAWKVVNDSTDSMHLHKGWFCDTVDGFLVEGGIALLRLDGDWYDSTMTCLRQFAPQMNRSGIIIIDDYFTWDGCCRAVHDYLSEHKSTLRLHEANGVCYLQLP